MNKPLATPINRTGSKIGSLAWKILGLLLLMVILTGCQPFPLSAIFAPTGATASHQDSVVSEQNVASVTPKAVAHEATDDVTVPVASETNGAISSPDPAATSAIDVRPVVEATATPPAPTVAATERLVEPERTPAPASEYQPVPRHMLIGLVGYSIDILGVEWQSIGDQWDTSFAVQTYQQPATGTQLTHCFAILEEDQSAEDIFGTLPPANSRLLAVDQGYEYPGNLRVFGSQTSKSTDFLVLLEADRYLYCVEIIYPQDEALPTLEEFYIREAADLVNHLLEVSLQKSRMVPMPTPTPLAPDQQEFYAATEGALITEAEANMYYTTFDLGSFREIQGTWEAVWDYVAKEQGTICRSFADRTNADVVLLNFSNCVAYVGPAFTLESVSKDLEKEGAEHLETEHNYPADFMVFGVGRAPITFLAYLLDEEFVYQVVLTSRSFPSQSTAEAYAGQNDEFVYKILMTNLEKNHRTQAE